MIVGLKHTISVVNAPMHILLWFLHLQFTKVVVSNDRFAVYTYCIFDITTDCSYILQQVNRDGANVTLTGYKSKPLVQDFFLVS